MALKSVGAKKSVDKAMLNVPVIVAKVERHWSSKDGEKAVTHTLWSNGHFDTLNGDQYWERKADVVLLRFGDREVDTLTLEKDGTYNGRTAKGIKVWGKFTA